MAIRSAIPLDNALQEVGLELRSVLPCAEALLVFGSALKNPSPDDIDIAIIIPDEMEAFEVICKLSAVLADLSQSTGLLISCFPISANQFHGNSTRFIKNVRENGREL